MPLLPGQAHARRSFIIPRRWPFAQFQKRYWAITMRVWQSPPPAPEAGKISKIRSAWQCHRRCGGPSAENPRHLRRRSVLDADGIIEPPHGAGATPKIPKFPGLAERRGVPDTKFSGLSWKVMPGNCSFSRTGTPWLGISVVSVCSVSRAAGIQFPAVILAS